VATANRTSYAILGLLSQGPKSGYEIKQVVEKTISHFWKESYGHLYPTLNRLLAEELVRREAAGGRHSRERQRYYLTDAGRAALEAWLATPVEPEGTRNELALKLYFGQSAPPAVSRAHLAAHREHHRRLLARYAEEQPGLEASAAAGEPGAIYELITLSLGVHISTARVAWCDEALARLTPHSPSATGSGA
jgi:PadR family transcriptional regulator, regulatory protein AphA